MPQRSAWIAARARNAARRGGWIATFGAVAAMATTTVLIVLPNEADLSVRRQIAALPMAPDTVPLVAHRELLRVALADTLRTVAHLDTLLDATAVAPRLIAPTTDASTATLAPDTLASDLRERILRARLSPIPDSYQGLAESPLLQGNERVVALLDSMERIDLEREAHAALGGPGARYAALTAQLTAIGQRLVGVAEGQLALHLRANASAAATTATISRAMRVASGPLVANERAARDSLLRQLSHTDTLLAEARSQGVHRDRVTAVLEQRITRALPPFLMFIAALVVGVAVGYTTVFLRELRRPTVGDAVEVERHTASPVFVHTAQRRTTRFGRSSRRAFGDPPPLIDRTSDMFGLLHLTLSGVGDAVSDVEVRSAEPMVSVALSLGIAAVAARESHAALLVETTRGPSVLARLLGFDRSDDVHTVSLDRDDHFDVWFGSSTTESFAQLLRRYDVRVYVVDRGTVDVSSEVRDVIIGVRQGQTTLAWLVRAMQRAKQRDQRVRAVVLWNRATPELA